MRHINYNFHEPKLVAFQNELLNELEQNNENEETETDESGDKDSGLNILQHYKSHSSGYILYPVIEIFSWIA